MKLSLSVGLAWPEVENLYSVGYRGQTVGRIWFAMDRRTDARPWEWHLCIPMALPDDTKGLARSKAEALQALANSLHTLVLRTPPDRLERALQFAAVAGSDSASAETVELSVEEIAASRASPEQPLAVRPASRHAALPAAEQATAGQQPAAAVVTSLQPPAPKPERAAKKQLPTVRVKMVTAGRGGTAVGALRPAPVAARPDQTTLPPATDVKTC